MNIKRYITVTAFLIITAGIHANYKMSKSGRDSIKKYESCSLEAYWDSNGYSIGYGHHSKNVKKGMRISKSKAERLFIEDVVKTEEIANRLLKEFGCKFSQGFFDGFCDLVYNCGEGGVKNSEFYNRLKRCRIKNGKINSNDLNYTVAAVKNMKISHPGHKVRRHETHLRMLNK